MMGDMTETAETAEDEDPFAGEWEVDVAPKRKSERRQRHAVVSVRLNLDELRLVEAEATKVGVGLSTYLRQAALQRAKGAIGVNSAADLAFLDSVGTPSVSTLLAVHKGLRRAARVTISVKRPVGSQTGQVGHIFDTSPTLSAR